MEVRVLVADDELEIRELLTAYLRREMYSVDEAADGEEAVRLFERNRYHMVILDLMMPRMDGMEVCRRIRSMSNVPILMLTAKDQELEKIVGLNMGADDYITKPFSIHEVVARVKALMRRFLVLGSEESRQGESRMNYKGLSIDLKSYTVQVSGEDVSLTAKEFELLKFLASQPGQVFTKTQLFRNVWNDSFIEDDNTVMVHIRKLRKKIEADPSNPAFIQTVWGIGYKFSGERL
ncbi:response regulator transcription factor [Paenibacillus terreus]|uniref:Response regulator transcription factor n=1 Tax=Paenibacillus terreus TaxID=1387834 RepID=A0ABV5BFM1_9BACL